MRIGMISTRPAEFWSVMANEGELLEKFGIVVILLIHSRQRIHRLRLDGMVKYFPELLIGD